MTELITQHIKELGGALSSFVLYPSTIPLNNCLLGTMLRWATGSYDKLTKIINKIGCEKINQRTEGPESRTDGETLIFWD